MSDKLRIRRLTPRGDSDEWLINGVKKVRISGCAIRCGGSFTTDYYRELMWQIMRAYH